MRINKYRGRRSYDKKWIYGSLLIDNSGDFHILESDVVEKDGHHIYIDSDSPMFFDNDTVGQFTGLHDKNGKEIYENDIILAGYYKWKCKVVWDEACVRFIGLTNDKDVKIVYVDMVDRSNESAVEVIGNIYENPELMKGDEL